MHMLREWLPRLPLSARDSVEMMLVSLCDCRFLHSSPTHNHHRSAVVESNRQHQRLTIEYDPILRRHADRVQTTIVFRQAHDVSTLRPWIVPTLNRPHWDRRFQRYRTWSSAYVNAFQGVVEVYRITCKGTWSLPKPPSKTGTRKCRALDRVHRRTEVLLLRTWFAHRNSLCKRSV